MLSIQRKPSNISVSSYITRFAWVLAKRSCIGNSTLGHFQPPNLLMLLFITNGNHTLMAKFGLVQHWILFYWILFNSSPCGVPILSLHPVTQRHKLLNRGSRCSQNWFYTFLTWTFQVCPVQTQQKNPVWSIPSELLSHYLITNFRRADGIGFKWMGFRFKKTKIHILALPCIYHLCSEVTTDRKLLNLFEIWFPHRQSKDIYNSTISRVVVTIKLLKNLAQWGDVGRRIQTSG